MVLGPQFEKRWSNEGHEQMNMQHRTLCVETYVCFIVAGKKFTIKALLCCTVYVWLTVTCRSLTHTHTQNALCCYGRRQNITLYIHSVQQKSIVLKFSKSRPGSDVRYICHHNSSRLTFPIFAHSCRFSVFHSLQSITPRIY